MPLFTRLDPFARVEATPREGFWACTGLGLLFFGLLYGVPTFFSYPYADHDYYFSITEVYRQMWVEHGRPLSLSWLFGGGVWLPGLAQFPGTSPGVLMAVVLGTVGGQISWTILQLSLGCGFAYGLLRAWGCNHRGAAIGAVVFWCSPWLIRHLADGHLPWAGFCFPLALAWLMVDGTKTRPIPLALAALAAAWLMVLSTPLQGVFYGLPLLAGAAIYGFRRDARSTLVVLLCLVAVLGMHLDFYLQALEGFELYQRSQLLHLQDEKFIGNSGAGTLMLRTLVGLGVPFVGYGYHAEGNLLAFLPLLFAVGLRPSKALGALLIASLVLGLIPSVGPIRQMDRMLWVFLLLVGLHCGRNEAQISPRALRASLAILASIAASMMALRWVMQPLSPLEERSSPAGIVGVAIPSANHPLQDHHVEGVFRSIRQGLVAPRPSAHVIVPTFPGSVDGALTDDERFQVSGHDGHLIVKGPFAEGQGVTLSLRGDEYLRRHLHTPSPARFEEDDGRLRVVATQSTDRVEVLSR